MLPAHDPTAEPRPALDTRRKRALFRAWHRGTLEMDHVMGRFADRELAALSDDDLGRFERLMEMPDPDVYNWVIGRAEPPPEFDTPLLARLRLHRG